MNKWYREKDIRDTDKLGTKEHIPDLAFFKSGIGDSYYYFNYETTPSMKIIEAIRITMSIPLIFNKINLCKNCFNIRKHSVLQTRFGYIEIV